jgi:pimeloyl-ACP methyl ester carboxylesterase
MGRRRSGEAVIKGRQANLFDAVGRPQRPHPLDILRELRAPLEALSFISRGLGHPWPRCKPREGKLVMLIPGFMAGDITLAPLARFCRWLGHRANFCGIWSNARCPSATLERFGEKLRDLSEREGCRVVLIGQSLGGVYARELALRDPDRIERVITLGAPITAPREACHPAVRALARSMEALRGRRQGCLTESCSCGFELKRRAVLVPITAVYSRSDGIVDWRSCIDQTGSSLVEHAEVMGSHVGMALSPDVFRIIADRLAMARRDVRPHSSGSSRVLPLRRTVTR